MADNTRGFVRPENLHEIAAFINQGGDTDGIEPIAVEESMQAFADAESIARTLGGEMNIGTYRVEQSHGWITVGYVFRYKPFVPAVRRTVPESNGHDKVDVLRRQYESLEERLDLADGDRERAQLSSEMDLVRGQLLEVGVDVLSESLEPEPVPAA